MKKQRQLSSKYFEIMKKHNNSEWARKELEWLVYDKYRYLYDSLSEFDRDDVDKYFDALIKIQG